MPNPLPTPKHDPGRSAAVGEDDGVCNAYASTVGIISVRRPAQLAECEWYVTCNGGKGEGELNLPSSALSPPFPGPTVVPPCPEPALPGFTSNVRMTQTSLSTRLFSLLSSVSAIGATPLRVKVAVERVSAHEAMESAGATTAMGHPRTVVIRHLLRQMHHPMVLHRVHCSQVRRSQSTSPSASPPKLLENLG